MQMFAVVLTMTRLSLEPKQQYAREGLFWLMFSVGSVHGSWIDVFEQDKYMGDSFMAKSERH